MAVRKKSVRDIRAKAAGLLKAERGSSPKPRGGRTTVALAYPNTYSVGMSSLGYQVVYRLINDRPGALAERVFLPDDIDEFKASGAPLFALESQSPVRDFEVVAFSVSYENDYINVAKMFRLAGLPPSARDRSGAYPLVVLGGVCASFNPEPISDFFDAVIIGEAEEVLPVFLDTYDANKYDLSRDELLLRLAEIPGVYIPSLYGPEYNTDGTLKALRPRADNIPARIKRRFVADLDAYPAHSVILTPNTEFSDMFMVEVSRGCGRHCRFCMAGYAYRPPRARSVASVLRQVEQGVKLTGKIGLVGAAISDYPEIAGLVGKLKDIDVNFSASSLRADSLTPEIVALVSKGNRTVAIAPEAGSERLRNVINKNITEEQILRAVRMLIEGGVLNVRLYFMVGLPTETDEDISAIVELAKKAHETQLDAARGKGRIGTLTLSVNCFIPKPWTPFQWDAMEGVDSLNDKMRRIKRELKGVSNISVINDVPKYAVLQCALSRGDRGLAEVIVHAAETGMDLKKAFAEKGLSMDFYAGRKREAGEVFPWDFIDTGVKKEYLLKEAERARGGCKTPPCNVGNCKSCGVC